MNTPSILLLCSLSLSAFTALPTNAKEKTLDQVQPVLQSEANFGVERPAARVTPNVSSESIWIMPATPEKIFPLLCPVLEYDWIPGWRTKLIHSKSGVAEEDCIFETRFAEGPMIWTCTRYEPSRYIEYTCFAQRGFVVRLQITLDAVPAGTRMRWSRSWLAYNAEGEAWVKEWNVEHHEKMMEHLKAEMEDYLRNRKLLNAAPH